MYLLSYSNNNSEYISTTTTYLSIAFPDDEWDKRIQDIGCAESELQRKRYRKANIFSVGPEGSQLFYYDLTSAAVDYAKDIQQLSVDGTAWKKLPNNAVDTKCKIVKTILQLRLMVDGRYILSQERLITFMRGVWGTESASMGVYNNNKVRLFGILII